MEARLLYTGVHEQTSAGSVTVDYKHAVHVNTTFERMVAHLRAGDVALVNAEYPGRGVSTRTEYVIPAFNPSASRDLAGNPILFEDALAMTQATVDDTGCPQTSPTVDYGPIWAAPAPEWLPVVRDEGGEAPNGPVG